MDRLHPLKSQILFLGGPSGSGKSFFASRYLTSLGWVHLEMDQFPKDAIAQYALKEEWDKFYQGGDPKSLHQELLCRAHGSPGIVLSFVGNLIFSPENLKAAQKHFHIAYLYGHPAFCLASFLRREKETGRGLTTLHWDYNNQSVYAALSCSQRHAFLIQAFNTNGSRRNAEDIFRDIF